MGRPWLRLETAFELLLCAWIAGTKKRPFVWDLMARWAGTYDRAINDFLYDNIGRASDLGTSSNIYR